MTHLEAMLIRIPPEDAKALRELSKRSRIPAATYHREAVADLLRKYDALPASPVERDGGGAE